MKGVELIRKLSECFGPTAFEGEVAAAIREELQDLPDKIAVESDRMGNLTYHLSGPEGAPRVMLSAHMDEVGVMITEIDGNGFLRFDTLGGIDPRVLSGRGVCLGDEKRRVPGVIAAKGIHLQNAEERKKIPTTEDMYIDVGARDSEEAENMVSLGTAGTFDTLFHTFGKDDAYLCGKALDDRMGCAILIEVLRAVAATPPPLDLWFCFTVREEIGRSGARVTANRIAPDIGIVIETTAIADLPEVDPARRVAAVGKGGVLSLADRSTIYDRGLIDLALRVAGENGIPVQIKRYVSGGNDAAHVQRSGTGTRCLALSAPTRYLHSPVSVASIRDYEAMRDLLIALLRDRKEF